MFKCHLNYNCDQVCPSLVRDVQRIRDIKISTGTALQEHTVHVHANVLHYGWWQKRRTHYASQNQCWVHCHYVCVLCYRPITTLQSKYSKLLLQHD